MSSQAEARQRTPDTVELPAPTAWPIVLAFGVMLVAAGMVTNAAVSVLGAILAVCGYIGWFRDVLPHEKMESVPVADIPPRVSTSRRQVERVEFMHRDLHRARLPLEIYPVSAGVKGGLAGGVAMAVLAMLYGILSGHGIWYPINLLSVGFFPAIRTTAQIAAFNGTSLIIASMIHLVTSLLVGLLYGVALPMFPRHPILFGGVIAPILWSGLLHSVLDVINPVMNERIDWPWFVISQIAFGIVAGIVVSRHERISTWQPLPLAVREGMEEQGAVDEKDGEDAR
jgi:hypothetical protein